MYTQKDLNRTLKYFQQQATSYELSADIKMDLLLNSDINTIVNLCGSDKEFKKICETKLFWYRLYQNYKLPLPKFKNFNNKRLFSYYMIDFIEAYNSLILAKYLALLPKFNFKLDYHYGGTDDVLHYLKKLYINYNLGHIILDNGIKLKEKDIGQWNPIVTIKRNKEKYIISLEILSYIYENEDDSIEDYDINLDDIAILTYDELILFLYFLIQREHFIFDNFKYGFNYGTVKLYKEKLNLPFYERKLY